MPGFSAMKGMASEAQRSKNGSNISKHQFHRPSGKNTIFFHSDSFIVRIKVGLGIE